MENFDIEKLEKKNIYKTPDFFAEMQKNVLKKTVYSINPVDKVENINAKKSNNWIYSAAASVAVVLGISMFWNHSKNENNAKIEVAKTEVSKQNSTEQLPVNTDLGQSKTVLPTFAVAETPKLEAPKPAKFTVPDRPKVSDRIIDEPKYASGKDLAQNEVDKIVGDLPANDLAELSNDADADVYLDLYN